VLATLGRPALRTTDVSRRVRAFPSARPSSPATRAGPCGPARTGAPRHRRRRGPLPPSDQGRAGTSARLGSACRSSVVARNNRNTFIFLRQQNTARYTIGMALERVRRPYGESDVDTEGRALPTRRSARCGHVAAEAGLPVKHPHPPPVAARPRWQVQIASDFRAGNPYGRIGAWPTIRLPSVLTRFSASSQLDDPALVNGCHNRLSGWIC